MNTTLAGGVADLGLPLDRAALDRLLAYRDELVRWNRVHNLSGVRDPGAMIPLHLLDSLALAPFVRATRVADIGSGAGLPGLPLALTDADLVVTLIEPRAKRALFLEHVVRTLGIGNVIVERARAEDLPGAGAFDTLVARAFGSLAQFVAAAAHLRRPGGILLAAKGRHPGAEVEDLPPGWRAEIRELAVPGVDARRHAAILRPADCED